MEKTLNDFQNQLSESFFSKIYLLEKIIGNNHWLTSGTFKEKVLITFLNNNLPKRFTAKSGFVVFPKKRIFEKNKTPKDYDFLNNSSYILSKQIDILVYDSLDYSPVFEDENIVLLSPESVKSVIEVKGTIDGKHLKDSTNLLIDYRNKWLEYKTFSDELNSDNELCIPTMFIYCWEFKKNKKGHRSITGKYIREYLARLLNEETSSISYRDEPFINTIYIYNECEISLIASIEEDLSKSSIGFMTTRGYSVKYKNNGELVKGGDKSLFQMLRSILVYSDSLKNRFLIDTDDSDKYDLFAHQDTGYEKSFDLD